MKKSFILPALLLAVFAEAAPTKSCNAPTVTKTVSEGWNTVIYTYPAGNCDFIGITNSAAECRKMASRDGYDCYQVGYRKFIGTRAVLTPYCHACIE